MGFLVMLVVSLAAGFGAWLAFPKASQKSRRVRDGKKLAWGGLPGVALACSVLAAVGVWFFDPYALNLAFASSHALLVLSVMVPFIVFSAYGSINDDGEDPQVRMVRLITSGLLGVFALVLLVAAVSGSELLHSRSYRELLGQPVNEGVKLPKLKLDRAPLVDRAMALQEAQKLLSQDPGLGSQVEIPHMYKQLVRGKLVWVGFMEPSSFSRWLSNGTTPGYAVVSATDPADAKLVTGLKMRYLKDAYLLDNVERHAQLMMPSRYLTDFSEEIDDSGKPYFVATLGQPAVGTVGVTTAGTVLIDPVTGHLQTYSVASTPAWVDRIQPRDFVSAQVNCWGEYVHGYWNSVFSGNGVLAPSNRAQLLYGDDGHAYWYVGLTSTGNDNGIVGFLLVDSRTKKAYRYQLAGANEEVAMSAVEGLVRANHYQATQPVVFEVEGVPTYVMTLTDSTGIIRGYGLVNVRNYQVAVEASTLQDAAQAYATALQTGQGMVNQSVKHLKATGVILRKQADVQAGSTTYYLVVQGVAPILTATTAISQVVPVLQKGDKVTVTYAQGSGPTAVVQSITLDGKLQ